MTTTIRITARRDEDVSAEQRGALLRRIAVAGVLIALLIGGLAVFDASRRSHDDEDDAEPAPAAVSTSPAPAAVSAVPPEETPAVSALPAALQDSPPPLPEGDGAEAAATPSASTAAEPAAAGAGNAPPHAQPARALASAPASKAAPAVATVEPAVPEATARPGAPVAAPDAADARRPSAERAARAEPSAPPALTRSPAGGYVVQAGVFSHTANAEELRARLALHGIPAQVETRVLVGPFRTRAEADRARAQMRALGLDGAPPVAR